jgi:hypothetical protein
MIGKLPNVPRNAIEEAKVIYGEKDPGKCAFDEIVTIGCFADQRLDRFAIEPLIAVLDRRASDNA